MADNSHSGNVSTFVAYYDVTPGHMVITVSRFVGKVSRAHWSKNNDRSRILGADFRDVAPVKNRILNDTDSLWLQFAHHGSWEYGFLYIELLTDAFQSGIAGNMMAMNKGLNE